MFQMFRLPRGWKTGDWGWNRIEIPQKEFENRVNRIREVMAREDLDVLLIHAYGNLRQGNICYFSNMNNYYGLGRWSMMILPKEQAPVLIGNFSKRDLYWFPKALTWIKDVRVPYEPAVPIGKATKRVLEGLNRVRRIGISGAECMPLDQYDMLRKEVPNVEYVDVTGILEDMRMLKNDREIRLIRKGCRIADTAYEALLENTREGRYEYEVLADIDKASRLAGSEDILFLMSSGPYAMKPLRMPEDRKLKRGDAVLLLLAIQYCRYWVQLGRTIVIGSASNEQSLLFEAAIRTHKAIRDAVKPGISASKLAGRAMQEATALGYGKHLRIDYGFGHGIGLDVHERPEITEADNTRLEKGMVIATQIGIHERKAGGAFLSDTFLITAQGCEQLGQSPCYLGII